MKFKIKKRWIAIIVVIILALGGLGYAISKGQKPEEVETIKVLKKNLEATIQASGVVEENITRDVFVDIPVKIKEVLVEKNDKVKIGQKIMGIDLDSLYSQLSQEKLNLEMQQLTKQKMVVSDDISSDVSLVQAKNALDSAKENYDRSAKLFESEAIPRIDLDNAKKAYENAKAAYELASENKGKDLEITDKQIQLTELRISDLKTKISKLESAMYSPISGIISELNVVDGGMATTSAPAYKVVDNTNMKIKANVKEFTIKDVKEGQKVNITGDAFDGITYKGNVKYVSPIAWKNKTAQGEETFIEVMIEILDKDTLLKGGINVTCDIVTSQKSDVLVIPIGSFTEDKDDIKYVYVVENGLLKKIKIDSGINSEEEIEVVNGAFEGMEILRDVNSKYKEGMKATVKKVGI